MLDHNIEYDKNNKLIYYTIYKITNIINFKIYLGVHKTTNINDNYMGSGVYLKRAQKKYGIKNFKKEILFVSNSSNEAYEIEKDLVNEQFIIRHDVYNLKIGGVGGRHSSSFTLKEKLEKSKFLSKNNPAKNMSVSTKRKMSQAKLGKPSNAKGNKKIKGDNKWLNTSHKNVNNSSAKKIIIYNNNNKIMFECLGTFYNTLKVNKMPLAYFRKSLALGESYNININKVSKINRPTLLKYKGWYAKDMGYINVRS